MEENLDKGAIEKVLRELEQDAQRITSGNASHQRGNLLQGIRYLIKLIKGDNNNE